MQTDKGQKTKKYSERSGQNKKNQISAPPPLKKFFFFQLLIFYINRIQIFK